MNKYLSSSLNSVVSFNLDSSWATESLQEAIKRARLMDARFQQKQIQEKEEKLLRLYESQQKKTIERVGRGSAGSNTSNTSNTSIGSTGGGKVRQMFEERRQKAGIDRSYPLQPLKVQNRGGSVDRLNTKTTPTTNGINRTSIKNNTKIITTQIRNGKPSIKKETISTLYNNNNGDEKYEEYRFKEDNQKLIDMMNKHNLDDNIEDETLPDVVVGVDELDNTSIFGKLPNVGGKLPSQRVAPKKVTDTPLGKTFRKETKPIVKKNPVKPSSPSSNKSPTSPLRSPVKSTTTTTTMAQTGIRQPPSNNRPSSKQPPPKATPIGSDLVECKYCQRRFANDRIQKHEDICGKASRRKRKVYDATKHRIEGTELEQFSRAKPAKPKVMPSKTVPKKDWRKTHEEFISAIRAAKEAQAHIAAGGKLSDLPPPPPSSNPDYVQCPHCSRKFNEAAAERHIPKCATFLHNKPKPSASKSNKSGCTIGSSKCR